MRRGFFIAVFVCALRGHALSIEQNLSGMQLAWNSEQRLVYEFDHSETLAQWTHSDTVRFGNGEPMRIAATNVTGAAGRPRGFFRMQSRYQHDEEYSNQDMLTPGYYNATNGAPFRDALDEFLYFSQTIPFHHPLQNGTNSIPLYHVSASGYFGADKTNPGGIVVESHPATDLYVGNQQTAVDLFAAYDGTVSTARDLPKYRQAVYLTQTVTNSAGEVLGKLVTLYAHVDLDLDEAGGLFMDGQTVTAGDLISKHLYSGTMGGPHLHFEIRYYRPGETGNEEYYGFSYTEPSAGIWDYGTWDPDTGYGFGNPVNHGLTFE